LIIDSPELSRQMARRFDEMVRPDECYILELRPPQDRGGSPRLVWRTRERGQDVEYTREPARSGWQRIKGKLLALLPIRREL
jgi:putative cardiolipin synthase